MTGGCFHKWTLYPPNQHNTYKCLNCGALGVLNTRTQKITPYKCMKPGCTMWATERVDGARYCTTHAREAKEAKK